MKAHIQAFFIYNNPKLGVIIFYMSIWLGHELPRNDIILSVYVRLVLDEMCISLLNWVKR